MLAARCLLLAAGASGLAACSSGQDPVGTPVTWWHDLEGGVIAEQRPPPPGVDDPYPKIGTTPAHPPTVPSKTARDALTASLAEQRTVTHRLDTDNPMPQQAGPPQAGTPGAANNANPGPGKGGAPAATASAPSSATIDAAGTTPDGSKPPPPKPLLTPEQQEANEPVLAMPPPPVAPASASVIVSGPLPQMPAAPPPPPSFPGFEIPTTEIARIAAPDYVPETAREANLAFAPGSDAVLPEARGVLNHAAASRGGHLVSVRGFGDARSDDPADQASALRLALARAEAAAGVLEELGVPAASIRLAAGAFGRGGDVAVLAQ